MEKSSLENSSLGNSTPETSEKVTVHSRVDATLPQQHGSSHQRNIHCTELQKCSSHTKMSWTKNVLRTYTTRMQMPAGVWIEFNFWCNFGRIRTASAFQICIKEDLSIEMATRRISFKIQLFKTSSTYDVSWLNIIRT